MKLLNGEMIFDKQEGAPYYSSAVESRCLERLRFMGKGSGQFSVRRSDTAPAGFMHACQVAIITPSAGMVHDDNYHLEWPVEGVDMRGLMWGTSSAVDLPISFQFAASVNGDYSITIMEGRNTIHYVTTIAYNAGGGFQQFNIVIPACTSGSWQSNTLSTYGLKLLLDLGTGSDYESAPNQWLPYGAWRAPNSVRLIDHAGAACYIAALQAEPAPFIFVDYDDQQRYINTANTRLPI